MLRMRTLPAAVLASCVLLASADPADACTCFTTGPESAKHSEALFEATVDRVVGPLWADGLSIVTLREIRMIQGRRTRLLLTLEDGCGWRFVPGRRYLVDARQTRVGVFATSVCSGTRQIERAEPPVASEPPGPSSTGSRGRRP
jgi:hypothetical protein